MRVNEDKMRRTAKELANLLVICGGIAGAALAQDVTPPLPLFDENSDVCGHPPVENAVQIRNARALLVGIDTYADPYIPDLSGTINDVCRLRNTLITTQGLADDQISILTNEAATQAGMLAAFDRLGTWSNENRGADILVYYAGHGSRLLDDDGDERLYDGLDEVLLPQDANFRGERDIRDDTLGELFGGIAASARSLTVVFDSCHSGTALRSNGAYRRVDRAYASTSSNEEPPKTHLSKSLDDLLQRYSNITYISATSENETAIETSVDGLVFGAFSHALTEALNSLDAPISNKELIERVRIRMEMRGVYSQTPTIVSADTSRTFLGIDSPRLAPFLVARPTGTSPSFLIYSGRIHGETVGSLYEFLNEAGDPTGLTARVEAVDNFSSELHLTEGGSLDSQKLQRVRKRTHAYTFEEPSLHVVTEPTNSTLALSPVETQRLTEMMKTGNRGHWLADTAELADYRLEKGVDNQFVLRNQAGYELASLSDLDEVARSIDYWENWKRVSSLRSDSMETLIHTTLTGLNCEPSADLEDKTSGQKICVTEGAEGPILTIRNTQRAPVWVNIIAVNPSGAIAQLGRPREVAPGRYYRTPRLRVTADSGSPETTILKVFASEQRVDLSVFEQRATRSDGQTCASDDLDSLNSLLCAANGNRRDVVYVDTGSWSVNDLSITVNPATSR